jgi:hypothetical protein
LNYLDEEQLARRIERRLKNSQRSGKLLNLILCAVVLVLGIAILLAMIRSWFTAF